MKSRADTIFAINTSMNALHGNALNITIKIMKLSRIYLK